MNPHIAGTPSSDSLLMLVCHIGMSMGQTDLILWSSMITD